MEEDVIRRADFFGLTHYEYGEAYFGSHKGMRYRLALDPLRNIVRAPEEEKAQAVLKASIWKAPYAYAKTPADEITDHTFPFSEEGIADAVAWFNAEYAAHRQVWEEALIF